MTQTRPSVMTAIYFGILARNPQRTHGQYRQDPKPPGSCLPRQLLTRQCCSSPTPNPSSSFPLQNQHIAASPLSPYLPPQSTLLPTLSSPLYKLLCLPSPYLSKTLKASSKAADDFLSSSSFPTMSTSVRIPRVSDLPSHILFNQITHHCLSIA